MIRRSRAYGRTRTAATVAVALLACSCAQIEHAFQVISGGSDGVLRATVGVQAGVGEPKEAVQGAGEPRSLEPLVARYMALSVQPDDSQLAFTLHAPLEQIRGSVSGVSGKLMVNPEALHEMTGLLTADLSSLQLFQRVRASEQSTFGAEGVNAAQNTHARHWLEIGPDVPETQRNTNRKIEFRPTKVEVVGAQTLSDLAAPGSSATLRLSGELTVHGVTKPVAAVMTLTADINQGQLNGLRFRSVEPIPVELAAFGIEPRDGFGKLAQRTLSALAPKVTKEAMVTIDCVARPHSL